MQKIKNFFNSSLFPPLILVLITLLLSYLNFQPNTWLTGWDNLHPEFNFNLYFHRYLSVWQEYRGLGLLGGMAHSADLTRTIFLYFLSGFFNANLLRYFWTFICLIFGVLGTYALTHKLVHHLNPNTKGINKISSFFAALFYLLNLSTLQTFYIPFETFTSFYLFLPWLLYSDLNYLNKTGSKNISLLIIIHILASSAFYVQTLFIVYLICLFPLLISSFFATKKFAPLVNLILSIFITQSYWLLPVSYFTITNSNVTVNSQQNLISTPEISLRNQQYGDIADVILLKGFNFNYVDLGTNNQFTYLLGPWVSHLNNHFIIIIGFILFSLVLIGIIYSFLKKTSILYPFLAVFLISFFALINLNPPTQKLYQFLIDHLPLFKQIFRNVYTKWSIPAALSYSIFFGIGLYPLLKTSKKINKRFGYIISIFSLSFLIFLFNNPSFQGYFIYPNMQIDIPKEYFQLFDFFSHQDTNTRTMNLPQHTFWGWEFYNWGYRGSGFLWYGIEQPILDRAFDVWSPYSENYYFEVQKAIYSQNQTTFEDILEKYSINWIIIDESIINPDQRDQNSLYLNQLEQLLKHSNKIEQVTSFNYIKVFKTKLETNPQNFFSTEAYLPITTITPDIKLTEPIIFSSPNNFPSSLSQASNCNAFNSTFYDRQITKDAITYKAINANSCDHLLYPSLTHSLSYQVKITHQNIQGQPLRICIEHYPSGQCLVYKDLPKSAFPTTSDFIIPAMNPDEYGYTLHFYNNSFGNSPSQNKLFKIEIIPTLPQIDTYISPYPSDRYATIITSQKHDYTLYTASVNSETPYSYITLNQAFDKGWKAYLVSPNSTKQPSWLLYLRTLTNSPIPETQHQQINTWANAWLVPPGDYDLIIVYQPQFLQFLGFGLLLFIPPLIYLQKHKKASE